MWEFWHLYGFSLVESRRATCRREKRCPWTEPRERETFGKQAEEESGKETEWKQPEKQEEDCESVMSSETMEESILIRRE